MIKYIIVDDEPLARQGMRLNTNKLSFLEHKGSFKNAIEAMEFLKTSSVDLMFLDIEMPGLTGLDFIRTLKDPPFIILCTAYPQYALESYELDVIDYLVKPIKFDRFCKAVNKAQEYIELKTMSQVEVSEYEESFMFIKADRQYIKVYYDTVQYIKGMKDYVVIHTDKEKYMTAMNVKTILRQLPPQLFARTSKSYIVQVRKIDRISTDTLYLGELELPLGPSYKEGFLDNYVKKNLVGRS